MLKATRIKIGVMRRRIADKPHRAELNVLFASWILFFSISIIKYLAIDPLILIEIITA